MTTRGSRSSVSDGAIRPSKVELLSDSQLRSRCHKNVSFWYGTNVCDPMAAKKLAGDMKRSISLPTMQIRKHCPRYYRTPPTMSTYKRCCEQEFPDQLGNFPRFQHAYGQMLSSPQTMYSIISRCH